MAWRLGPIQQLTSESSRSFDTPSSRSISVIGIVSRYAASPENRGEMVSPKRSRRQTELIPSAPLIASSNRTFKKSARWIRRCGISSSLSLLRAGRLALNKTRPSSYLLKTILDGRTAYDSMMDRMPHLLSIRVQLYGSWMPAPIYM